MTTLKRLFYYDLGTRLEYEIFDSQFAERRQIISSGNILSWKIAIYCTSLKWQGNFEGEADLAP